MLTMAQNELLSFLTNGCMVKKKWSHHVPAILGPEVAPNGFLKQSTTLSLCGPFHTGPFAMAATD